MVNTSALASSEPPVAGHDNVFDAAADLWAVIEVADMLPATPETRQRLVGARAALGRQLGLLGWDEAILRERIRNRGTRERPPDPDPSSRFRI